MTDKVGKGVPPDHSKWPKGVSGNKSGRPKGSRNLRTIIVAELNRKVRTSSGKMISMAELIAKRLVNELGRGELKYLTLLVRLMGHDPPEDAAQSWNASEAKLFDEFKANFLKDQETTNEQD